MREPLDDFAKTARVTVLRIVGGNDAAEAIIEDALRSAAQLSVPLSAIRALVQQWRELARPHLDASGDEAEWAHCRWQCADELEALCPAPPEDRT